MILAFTSYQLHAQARWDGEAGDGLWSNPINWQGNTVPAATDSVLLDNSLLAGNYTIYLPAGINAVTVKSLSIAPASATTIQLVLPATSTALPAFRATGPGHSITIHNGGVFINASALTGGSAIEVSDSFSIANGGRYIHNSRSAHANLVTVLSRAPGTERGIFEFDVPGGPYTFAATGRTYGSLVFSAGASGGSQIYNSIGSSPLQINGDAVVNTGVTVNLDINNNVFINHDLIQYGGVFNIAAQPNNTIVFIKGNISQSAGIITETSGGLPAIELNGTAHQYITVAGGITNSVTFRINNTAGVSLLDNMLLPFNLTLTNGNLTSAPFLLTLANGCSITTDSATGNSFINGRLRKEGLTGEPHFFFPVGKGVQRRWLALQNVTGNYTVEFFQSNPQLIEASTGAGIDHISGIEYWTIEADTLPLPSAKLELSFDNVNSGGVTSLAALHVATLANNQWQDAGSTATTGVVGLGSVTSADLLFHAPGATKYFTLASTDAVQNPLPQKLLSFTKQGSGNNLVFHWQISREYRPAYFELQASPGNNNFRTLAMINAVPGRQTYTYSCMAGLCAWSRYRLKLTDYSLSVDYSNVITNTPGVNHEYDLRLLPSVVHNNLVLQIKADENGQAGISITDTYGRVMMQFHYEINRGNNLLTLSLPGKWPPGIYYTTVTANRKKTATVRFVKQ